MSTSSQNNYQASEVASDTYFLHPFRTSLRQTQCFLGLVHIYFILEHLPLKTVASSSLFEKVVILFHMWLVVLGVASFFFSGFFMEYNEKNRTFDSLRCDMPLPMVANWFSVGVPEAISVFLAISWLVTSVVLSLCIPDLQGYIIEYSSLFDFYLQSLWSCCHQLNAIAWTASAFLTVVDLLNFLS